MQHKIIIKNSMDLSVKRGENSIDCALIIVLCILYVVLSVFVYADVEK
jgi:hypothetical protein